MNKWLLRILYAALVMLPIGAIADYTATQGAGSTVFSFVCFATKICPAHVLTNSAGTEIATSGNPVRIDPTGTTPQPISAASLPLAPLAATSTKQSDGTQKSQQVDGSGNVAPAGDTAARAGFQKLTDGTNTAAVKAPSTGAAATDPSAVTNESPNSQLSIDMHTTAVNSAAALPAQSNSTTNIGAVSGIVNVTPTDCSGTVATGGTAQSAISASATIHGFTIANVDASAGSGEPLWISFTGTASAANGSYPLAPPAATTFASNGSYTTPMGFGANHAVSIFAATTGHKFSCTTW